MQTVPSPLTVEADARVYCPKCGYELTPIPQGQCSECGFGYDHKAIRDVATEFALNRISSYETATTLGIAATACFGVMLLPAWTLHYLGASIVAIGVCLTNRTRYYYRENSLGLAIAMAMPAVGVLILLTSVFDYAGVVFLVLAAVAGFYHRSEWQYLPLTVTDRINKHISMRRQFFIFAISLAAIAGIWRLVSS